MAAWSLNPLAAWSSNPLPWGKTVNTCARIGVPVKDWQ